MHSKMTFVRIAGMLVIDRTPQHASARMIVQHNNNKNNNNNNNNNKYIYKAQKTKGFYALYMVKHNVQYKLHAFI